jgi:uncharacterized membrane protein
MTNLVVLSFTNESQAIEASHKMIELESLGDITVYEKVIVKKEANGEVTVLQTNTTEGVRTLSGMAIGTLVGALAGPVGVLAGMATGTLIGTLFEADYFDFSDDFGSKVVDRLQPGTVAIIAEVYEDDPAFLDNTLAPLDVTISRSDVDYVHGEFIDNQIEEIDEEIAAERASIKSAVGSEKSKIQQKIARLKEKRQKRIADLKEKERSIIAKVKAPLEEEKKTRLIKMINRHKKRAAELEEKLHNTAH